MSNENVLKDKSPSVVEQAEALLENLNIDELHYIKKVCEMLQAKSNIK